MKPFYVRLNAADNVAIIANPEGTSKGTEFACGLIAQESIPQANKIALCSLAQGEPIIRYGEVIGHASRAIPQGAWVREDCVTLPSAPDLDQLPLATAAPLPLPALDGFCFQGYRNPDGSVGTKNILGIMSTVQCAAPTLEYAVRRIKAEILPRYRALDDVVAITTPYGCGVAINAPGAQVPIRTLRNMALNPNLGGEVMSVSLGCEKLQPSVLAGDAFPILPNEPWVVRLQDEQYRCFGDMITAIMRFAEIRMERLNLRTRTACPASELSVGLQCGGSDAFSGVTANPAVGFAADLLVRAGATVMFSEVTEVRDAAHLVTRRAANVDVARPFTREMAW